MTDRATLHEARVLADRMDTAQARTYEKVQSAKTPQARDDLRAEADDLKAAADMLRDLAEACSEAWDASM